MVWLAALPALASAGVGIYQSLAANKQRQQAQADAEKALANQPNYQIPDSSRQMLADARSRANAVNPALLMAQQQAQQGAAGTIAAAQRNATSGAEALAVGGAAQSQLQAALPGIAGAQTAYDQSNRGNYYNALSGMSAEQRAKMEADRAKHSDLINFYLGKAGGAGQNLGQGITNTAGGLMGAAGVFSRLQWPQGVNATQQPISPYNFSANQYAPMNDGYYPDYSNVA